MYGGMTKTPLPYCNKEESTASHLERAGVAIGPRAPGPREGVAQGHVKAAFRNLK